MIPRGKTWLIDVLDLQIEAWIPEPGEFPTEEEREENRGLWFDLTCFTRYPEPYYADELIEAVLDIHEAVTGRRMVLHGDTHDDYVWDRIYSDMEFAAVSCAFRLKKHEWAPLPVLDEVPEINYSPQPIVPERLTYIGVKIVDQDGEPVERSRVRVKLPDGDIREGRTDRDGELMIKGFGLDGIAEIELLDFLEALPEAAAANEEETETAEEVAAAEELLVDEKEFVVKVVDETGKGVSGVSLVFSGAGTSKSVPTDGGGVAKWKAAAESVEVTFESAEAVNRAMKAVWKGRAATAEGDYVQPSTDTAVVVSRAKAIETPDGGMFSSTSVDATQPMTLSVRPAKKRALLIELHDTLFRNSSAVVNPEGEAPSSTVGEHESITTVGLIATILRYNEEHEGKKLFVAGHTDRAGSEGDNVKLSEHRAKAVVALIEGKKEAFVAACKAKYSEVDVTQLMDWTNRQYGFTCKPTTLIENPSDPNYYRFRTSYNEWVKGPLEDGEFGPRGTAINGEGRMQPPDIWDAMFDLYEHNLRQELGEDEAGVAQLRSKLVWVDGGKKTIGFGEKHPTAENTVDGTRSQADRRVEVMLFDEEDLPNLAATNGEDVYDGVTFERKTIEPLKSAKPWRAEWDALSTGWTEQRQMLLTAPGLAQGEVVNYSIWAIGTTSMTRAKGSSLGESANTGWVPGEDAVFAAGLTDGPYHIMFAAEAGGRRAVSREALLLFEYAVSVRTLSTQLLPNEALELVSADGLYKRRVPLADAEPMNNGRTRVRFGALRPNSSYSLYHFADGQVPSTVFAGVPVAQIHNAGKASAFKPSAPPALETAPPPEPNSVVDSWLL